MKTMRDKILLAAAVAFAAVSVRAMLSDEAALKAARETLAKMTLEEKNSLLGGSGTMTLAAIPRVGILKEWTMSDSSSTVRPTMDRWTWAYTEPQEANTKLPSLSALAQTWDPAWARRHGEVLGAECRDRGVDEILGPGVNILRQPLNGRNWEYLGEDPLLAAKLCVPMIEGIQSYDVAATIKHYALNNQEWGRFDVDVHVDDRTLNEIYLPAFRAAVKEAKVLCVMNSFSRIDGIYASENKYLMTGILRERWGFKGLLETDWGGQHSGLFAINNGAGVEMNRGGAIKYLYEPASNRFPVAEGVRAGLVPAANVDMPVLHVLYTMAKVGFLTGAPRRPGARNTPEHQRVAREEGTDSIVLAKNDAGVLPLAKEKLRRVLVVGPNAVTPQCRKGGSGEGKTPYEVTLLDAVKARLPGAMVEYLPFCARVDLLGGEMENAIAAGAHVEKRQAGAFCSVEKLKAAAEAADAVLVFTGTELGHYENMESEGRDRKSMDLPPAMEKAMHEILGWKLPQTVVISRAGSPVGYTWVDKAPTLLMTSYLGMEEGNSLCDVLFGDVNPSGKLVQSWPRSYAESAVGSAGTYNPTNVTYVERFYVGYRWHDHKKLPPLFAFGHGLSYTTFAYGRPTAERTADGFVVRVDVTNTGKRAGKEVVQVYASYPDATVERCVKELKGFCKVALAPGETKSVAIPVTLRDLAYWDDFEHGFRTAAGRYAFLVGSASDDIRGRTEATVGETHAYAD